MYSPKQVLKQEPAGIVTALALINAALIAFDVYSMTDAQLSAANAAVLGLLTLFYIRPATVTRDALRELDEAAPLPVATPVAKPAVRQPAKKRQ